MTTWTPELQQLAVDLLVRSARLTRLAGRRRASELAPATWRALAQIEELGPLRVGDLAQADRTSQPTATAVVQRLADRGLVARDADPDDARAVLVSITPTGRRVLEEHRVAAAAEMRPELETLTEAELDALRTTVDVLDRLVRAPVTA